MLRSERGKSKTNTCKSDFTTPLQLVYQESEDARQAVPGTTVRADPAASAVFTFLARRAGPLRHHRGGGGADARGGAANRLKAHVVAAGWVGSRRRHPALSAA